MGRQRRAVRRYEPPVMKPRCYWGADELKKETLAMARLAQSETELAPAPDPTPEPAAPATPKPPRKRKPVPTKAPVKFSGRLAWGADGTVLGWLVEGTEEIEPLSLRPERKINKEK